MAYDWVTNEMFDAELERQVSALSGAQILAIPGVYEVLSDYLNNAVLEALRTDTYTHLLPISGSGAACGEIRVEVGADINVVDCPECLEIHEKYMNEQEEEEA